VAQKAPSSIVASFTTEQAKITAEMRELDLLIESFALNLAWIGLGALGFRALLASARRAGSLLAMGE